MNIGSIAAAVDAPGSSASLGLQDFMKILLTQLTYQDPLKPMDNQAFMAQMAQFTSLEQSQRLNDKVQQLIDNQAAFQSVGLVGRTVEVATASGQGTGVVTALLLQGDAPLLTLKLPDGSLLQDVALNQILSVR
ncbi:flagellar hook assembly protein FlgD [Ramlibacter sp.]|uniref:flagellar hook assembly protein FlgD n=1 Tax=Ramlibacter sp. TaxID=1917967 RepID=UPI002FCBD912|nr:flagellar hook capping protein [Ramlibacter sp.]